MKRRLAMAKSHATLTAITSVLPKATEELARNVEEMAKKTIEISQSQLDGSQIEVVEAVKCLIVAKKKLWEVDGVSWQEQDGELQEEEKSVIVAGDCLF